MSGYSIATSGLTAAQAALDVIGNNVANAATDGYHRQRIELAPSAVQSGAEVSGSGVNVLGVTQLIDDLLEREILSQESGYAQISQQLSVLTSIEAMLGEFSAGTGLNQTLDAFFQSLDDLSANPLDSVSQNAVLMAAKTLAIEFRRLGDALASLNDQILLQAESTIDSINALSAGIAELNKKIHDAEVGGNSVENLRDHRGQLIAQLADLVGVDVKSRDFGAVDIFAGGSAIVSGAAAMELAVELQADQSYGVSLVESQATNLEINGGRLGGLLTLANESLADLRDGLDAVARGIITAVNQIHVQGLGTDGSFTELLGWGMNDDLTASEGLIKDGTFYVRVTNTSTGNVERHAIDVDVSGSPPDTLESIAAKIAAVTGLTAAVESSQLHITADQDYSFDFIPEVLSEPTASNLTGVSPPAIKVSGIYSGTENDTLTFSVLGSGSVGNDELRIQVTDQAGNVIRAFGVGEGYAAGDTIELSDGIRISLGIGDLNIGDSFEVDVYATTDTSGFLAAAGMNVFFSGSTACDMHVHSDIAGDPSRIATASGSDLTDNTTVLAMAAVRDQELDVLEGQTASGCYQAIVVNLGQDIALKRSREDNIEAMLQNLHTQRSDVSGVDINEEAAQMLIYQQMFQAMSQYMSTLRMTLDTLMRVL